MLFKEFRSKLSDTKDYYQPKVEEEVIVFVEDIHTNQEQISGKLATVIEVNVNNNSAIVMIEEEKMAFMVYFDMFEEPSDENDYARVTVLKSTNIYSEIIK